MQGNLQIDVGGLENMIVAMAKDAVKSEAMKILSHPKEQVKAFLTRVETAGLLNVSLVTLNKWDRGGILTPCKVGGRVTYPVVEINRLLNNRKVKKEAID